MELSVTERLVLLNTLPKEGDFTTLKIVRKLREDLSFTEDEHALLQFKTPDSGGMAWNREGDTPKEIPIGEKATDIIAGALKQLNAEKKLGEHHYSLYEKFVGE